MDLGKEGVRIPNKKPSSSPMEQARSPTFGTGLDGSIDFENEPGRFEPMFIPRSATDYTENFFKKILTADEEIRNVNLKSILLALEESRSSESPEQKKLFIVHLPQVVYFSKEAPFPDIRAACKEFLHRTKAAGYQVKEEDDVVSIFFPPEDIVPIDTEDEVLLRIFRDRFLMTGRVSHLARILAWHPGYLERFSKTIDFIMRDSGPLPLSWRNYLAILGASRHRSEYIISLQEQEFLWNGGDPQWLKGLDYIPQKLVNILELNALLAHQPWLITKDHLSKLLKGADAWSISELVQAIIILTTWRSIASMALSLGLTPETDVFYYSNREKVQSFQAPKQPSSNITKNTEAVLQTLKARQQPEEEGNPDELWEQAGVDDLNVQPSGPVPTKLDIERYIGIYHMEHTDFDVRSPHYNVFRVQDYCWDEQGYSLVDKFYAEAAPLLDEQFSYGFHMTYQTFNDTNNVDTSPFRSAIWHYIHRTKGFLHDDYNYREVNVYLKKQLKNFLKKISCYPEFVKQEDLEDLGYELQSSEKCHIVILAAEARKQAELVYGLHAIHMKHMSG